MEEDGRRGGHGGSEVAAGSLFQDEWELLHNADEVVEEEEIKEEPPMMPMPLQGIEADSGGVIRSNYFSLHSVSVFEEEEEDGSVDSDNPSWIDPEPETMRSGLIPISSDSTEQVSEISEHEIISGRNGLAMDESSLRAGGGKNAHCEGQGQSHGLLDVEEMSTRKTSDDRTIENESKSNGEEENRRKLNTWWKVPFELVKFCVFRVSPIWSFSVAAAAVMGFILLGRRLYNMKRKTQASHLKVTVDDKKVSQFMNRAARLNEVFSVVKRVPVVRPSLPTTGISPWPVMSLR